MDLIFPHGAAELCVGKEVCAGPGAPARGEVPGENTKLKGFEAELALGGNIHRNILRMSLVNKFTSVGLRNHCAAKPRACGGKQNTRSTEASHPTFSPARMHGFHLELQGGGTGYAMSFHSTIFGHPDCALPPSAPSDFNLRAAI